MSGYQFSTRASAVRPSLYGQGQGGQIKLMPAGATPEHSGPMIIFNYWLGYTAEDVPLIININMGTSGAMGRPTQAKLRLTSASTWVARRKENCHDLTRGLMKRN